MQKKDASKRSPAETIIPLSVPINNKGTDPDGLRRRHQYGIIMLICSVIILVGVGAWFLHYLSKKPLQPQPVSDKQSAEQLDEPAPAAAPPPETPPPAADPEKPALDKQSAEQKLAEFLEVKNELDNRGAPEWGGKFYTEMIEIGGRADSLLIEKSYQPASAEYARATIVGRQLAGQAGEALQRMLDEGRVALKKGDGAVAQSKFSVALMIDPSNQPAQKGLKRAQSIETVFELIESGKQHEKDNALSLARTEYQKALQLDPEENEARQALNKVTDRIKEQQFNQLMSAGLTAFHNNDYALARTRLLKAKAIKPDSREVSEALLQVDQAHRLARIDRLQDAAQKAEQMEDYQTALKSYLAVLKIDPNLQFAIRGKERAAEQIRITKRLDFFLSDPRELESDKQLKSAVLLLHEAREITPRGRKLTSRIEKLEELVAFAQTPVIVTIESDNLTQIVVYKVAKLGQFSQRELKLRPGTYTVVGARDGYQDVRQKIVVKAGQQPLRVTVKCRVKI
jgi:tetratricopeptide (TPR) repeat protein